MKKHLTIILTSAFSLILSKGSYGQELKSEIIMETNVSLNAPVMAGSRSIYTWTEGTVTGKIAGKLLAIGAEFGNVINATTFKIDVRTVIQTNDSATIYLTLFRIHFCRR